jgi:predicted small metal-binding protein
MPLTLSCQKLGTDCSFVIEGSTMEELISRASEHAVSSHGYSIEQARSSEMVEMFGGLIRNSARPPELRPSGPVVS